MKKMQLQDHEVHLSLIDDAKMQELNRTYRNKNKTTDVLSFEQGEHIGKHFFLGDILISLAQTKRQASVQRHRIKDELAILSIHGLLHLLGYDHMEIEDEKVMFAIQNDLFQQTLHF
ncbi:MAG: rRNA maturation RNase YbeY [Bdellovibrionota bacterium]